MTKIFSRVRVAAVLAMVVAGAVAGCASPTAQGDAAVEGGLTPVSVGKAPVAAANASKPAADFWGAFDAKADPHLLGNKVVDDLLGRQLGPVYQQRGAISYPEVCTGYGSLRFAGEYGDKVRVEKLTNRYATFFTQEGSWLVPFANNVDNSAFGILPMEVYRQQLRLTPDAADKKWLNLGKGHADTEWANPRADGLTPFTRYWIDDMFMVTALQAEAFRVTHDKVYLDRAAKEMVAYLTRLQQPNGLFFHGEDSPFYWGRGNGWMAVGSAELLSVLPEDHPDRKAILAGYQKMMAGLLKYQGKEGMWHQLIDKENSWPETSGSGMFVFGMAMGVRNGWLDEKQYKEPVKKAWTTLAGYLTPEGKVREVCVGTNKGFSEQYYNDRQRTTGDFHGQAAFIWAAWAMSETPGK